MTEFQEKCYQALKKIPKGKVTTYKQLAQIIGHPKAYRAVGTAMNKNPYAPNVPCHRVVNNDGGIGGFASSISKKIALLNKEGILVKNNKIVDFKAKLFNAFIDDLPII